MSENPSNNIKAPVLKTKRLESIDWMRGIVMILMVLDHVSMAYDANHFSADSAALFHSGDVVPPLVFFTRWVTHLCAPTFVFLAGTALAISVERRVIRGQDPWEIDKGIIVRGLFIAALDPTLISLFSARLTFQVLYAIGVSMILMAFIRRLSTGWLILAALAWWFGGEWVTGLVWDPFSGKQTVAAALLVAFYKTPHVTINYPVIPWLSQMILGWAFGRYLMNFTMGNKVIMSPRDLSLAAGLVSLSVFAVFRYLNGYGNMWLYRQDNSLVQWFMVSKYPPSLTYMALEIGIMCVCLAGLITLEKRIKPNPNSVLLVFGQTAMFFYLVHRIFLEGTATWLGLRGCASIREVYIITPVLLAVLYYLCLWFRRFRQTHPGGWTRFI